MEKESIDLLELLSKLIKERETIELLDLLEKMAAEKSTSSHEVNE